MRANNTISGIFLVLISAVIFLPGAVPAVVAAEDERVMVNLDKTDQQLFLIEMRTVLSSVHNILLALDENDMAAVAKAAEQSKSRIKNKSKNLLKKLPPDFKTYSKSVRMGFKQISKAAKSGAGKNRVISLLGEQLGRCVACHGSYRLR